MEELAIFFSKDQVDVIRSYIEKVDAETIQDAVMDAIAKAESLSGEN